MITRIKQFWRTCGPNREDGLAVVNHTSGNASAVMPVKITQVIGGPRWSLALVKTQPIDRDVLARFERTSTSRLQSLDEIMREQS